MILRSVMGLNSIHSTKIDCARSFPRRRSIADALSFFSATSLKINTAGAARIFPTKAVKHDRSCSKGLSRIAEEEAKPGPLLLALLRTKLVDGKDSNSKTGRRSLKQQPFLLEIVEDFTELWLRLKRLADES